MSRIPSSHRQRKEFYEQRFNCMVCLCPHLRMVTGLCQHRVCISCLYGNDEYLRDSFLKCPVCQYHCSFPESRPEIPEDNMELMRCLGVRVCPHAGCDVELWEWELDEHCKSCAKRPASPKAEVRAPKRKLRSASASIAAKAAGRNTVKAKGRQYKLRPKSISK